MYFSITSYSLSSSLIKKFPCRFNFGLTHSISVVVLLRAARTFNCVFYKIAYSSSFFVLPVFSNPCITNDCYFFLGFRFFSTNVAISGSVSNRIILISPSFYFKPLTFAYNILVLLFDCFFYLDRLTFFEWLFMFWLLLS